MKVLKLSELNSRRQFVIKFPFRLFVTAFIGAVILRKIFPDNYEFLLSAACFGAFLAIINDVFGLDFFNKGNKDEE